MMQSMVQRSMLESIYGITDYEDHIIHSNSIEQFHLNFVNFLNGLKPGEMGIYILDSLDPLKTEGDIDAVEEDLEKMNAGKDAKRGSYDMAKQKYLSSRFFPQANALLAEKQALRHNCITSTLQCFRHGGTV